MKLPPTPPSRSQLERFSLVLGAAVIGIGILTLTGWWLPVDELLLPLAGFAPLEINAALAFVAIGASLIAIEAGRPRLALVAVIAVVLGLLTLVEHVWPRDLGIDQLLGADRFGGAAES